jgi:hypothetical protein
VAASEAGVRRVSVPARGHRHRRALVPADNLSYRDVEELLVERGVGVDHATVARNGGRLRVVSDVDDFLADVPPRLRDAEIPLHSGDSGPRGNLWSHDDPVTLFGAEVNRKGWSYVAMDRHEWEELCYRVDAHPGKTTRHLNARRYIFGLLTGANLSNTKHRLAFPRSTDKHDYLGIFQRTISTPLRDALHEYAQAMLDAAGIHEPLTWSPPGDCVAGLTLPGRDPDDIDLDAVHQLVVDQLPIPIDADWLREQSEVLQRSAIDIAAELGLTPETVHHNLIRFGLARRPQGIAGPPSHMNVRPDLPEEIRRVVEGPHHGWLRLGCFQHIITYPGGTCR